MLKEFVSLYQNEFQETLASIDVEKLEQLCRLLEETFAKERNIFIIGNGGSAASASHWVCDFNKGVSFQRPKVKSRFYSLADNIPTITAYGNDTQYDDIFMEQLKVLSNPGDLLISLSVSGNSKNLLKAQAFGESQKMITVSITNSQANELKSGSDLAISIPSENYGIVEDCHMYICHVISQFIAKK